MTRFLMVVFTVAAVRAADRTWNGASVTDSNWSSSDNWGGIAPATGDTLLFGGTTRLNNINDYGAGMAFSGIVYTSGAGAFTLGGNGITLDGNISNLSTSAQTVNVPLTLSADRTIYGTNVAFTVNGVVSGPGGLTAAVTNTLTLTGDNDYAGVTLITNGCRLSITHRNALGSTLSDTKIFGRSGASLRLSGGIEVAEPIAIVGQILPWMACLIGGSGSNVISGLVTKEVDARVSVESGANTLVFAGGIKHISGGQIALNPNVNAKLVIANKPIQFGASANVLTEIGGTVVFAVPGNTFSELKIANQSVVRTDVAGVFSGASGLVIGGSWAQNGVLDLNGFDATFTYMQSDAHPTNPGYLAVTSAAPATLTLNQNGNTRYAAALAGAVRLIKNGTGTLTFTNVTSTTTGDIVVNAGTLAVAESGGFGASSAIRINGGTLELRNSASLNDAATVRVADGAKVRIAAGVNETVDSLFLDGEQQASGTWGGTGSGADHISDTFFAGGGVLSVASDSPVTYADARWDAGGGTDLSLSTAANWEGDTLPVFDGSARAIFASGGNTAVVDTAASFVKMTFNANGNFTVADGAGVITNGAGGLRASVPSTTSCTYTLAETLVFGDHQVWSITNNGAGVTTVDVRGVLDDGDAAYDLLKKGNGVLRLAGDNTYDGVTTVQTNGYIVVAHAHALGTTNGPTLIENGGYVRIDGGTGGGLTIDEPIIMTGDQSLGWAGTLRSNTGSNIWSGKITSNGARLRCESGACFEITGGVDGSSLVCSAYGSRWIRFTEKPITTGALTSHTGGGGVILAVDGNTFNTFNACGSFVRIDVPNAWLPTVSLTQGDGGNGASLLDLNGNSQTVGQWQTARDNSELRILFSVAPATLTVNQSANTLFNGSITGAVSIVKLGTGSLTLTNAFTTTSGGFTVSNGTLVVSNKGTFGPNSTNIVVGGGGTLLLSNSVAIADSATVSMPPSGTATAKINLAAGVNETVGWLYYGDVLRRAGTYGSSGSGASVQDDTHFSGTGVLTVLHDLSGTLISVW